jgi:O-antigen/teichoic acid export membrane protein
VNKQTAHKTSNNEQFFCTDRLKKELKQRSIRGGAVTILAQASKFILQMGSTVILARLLLPEDYGLIGMVTVTLGFAQLFKDLGLANATVQQAEITHQQVSTLFWLNFVISSLTAVIVAALAPVVSWFYQEPRLMGITLALSSIFVFGGLTVQHQALLRRQMYFSSLAKIEILSALFGILTAITAANYGFGYWALVLMQIVTTLGNALGVWWACSWRPGMPVKGSGIKSMLAFGGNLTGFNIVNYFSRNLDNILIGRYWGSEQLGLYAKAYQLLLLPIQQINTPITNVALPALSSLQNEPKLYSRYYYKAILLITTLGMPIVALMFASADKVILLILGKQWLGVLPLFKFLMPAAFTGTFNVAPGWVYQSLGKTDRQFKIGMVIATIHVTIFVVSVHWGAMGVAIAYGLLQPILMIFAVYYCYLGTSLKIIDFVQTIAKPAFAAISAAIILMVIDQFVLPANKILLLGLSIDCVLYSLLYLIIWLIVPGGKQTLLEIWKVFKNGFKVKV